MLRYFYHAIVTAMTLFCNLCEFAVYNFKTTFCLFIGLPPDLEIMQINI